MRRLHLFEIHDFSWCPKVFRDGLTDFLATSIARFDSYAPIRALLLQAIQESAATRIVDLCSGGGGPWMTWSQTVPHLPPVLLTDKFPNRKAIAKQIGKGVTYYEESVDATAVSPLLTGFRTIFTAAHHFQPETIAEIIADAVTHHQPIGIFELTHRSAKGIALISLSAIAVWLTTPMMKRITWSKLFFTYLVPVIPLMTSFDGVVSCLRTYTPDELSAMANYPDYVWKIGTAPGPALPVTYLIGLPKHRLTRSFLVTAKI